jgi:hypothetical protein
MNKTKINTSSLTPEQRSQILCSVKNNIIKHHFNVGGVDYDEWTRQFVARSPSLLNGDTEEFEDGTRKLLAELHSSHTVFYHERTNRLLPQHAINATVRSFELDGQKHWHFLDVFDGGPAHLAGLKRGERLLAVDRTVYVPPATPPFRIGTTHNIVVSNARGENTREITITVPFRKGTKSGRRLSSRRAPSIRLLPLGPGF